MRCTGEFLYFLSSIFGSRKKYLACVVRPIDHADYDSPFESMTCTFCTEHACSLEEEPLKRASQNYPLLKEDNAAIYYTLQEATRSTVCSVSINTF